MKNSAVNILLGVAIGDALGVPYEFSSREKMDENPAKDMIGYGTYKQPSGTWSDDSSLTFCLAEALLQEYDLKVIAQNFVNWKGKSFWAARGEVFDIGITTSKAISRIEKILIAKRYKELSLLKDQAREKDNGNGSLMRILPLIYEIKGKELHTQFEIVWLNSALTHRHIRAAMSCMIYLKLAEFLLEGLSKIEAYQKTRINIQILWKEIDFSLDEHIHFNRMIQNDISSLEKNQINSSGYVIDSLEASLWCFLKTNSFEEAILTAVNLGRDTDTIGAITGGLAGLFYGRKQMPEHWIVSLARMEDILDLGERLNKRNT
jgi:ADP-ribosylglycohydrolase